MCFWEKSMNDISFAGNLSGWAWFTVWSLTNRAPRLFSAQITLRLFQSPREATFFPHYELDHGNKSYILGEITPRRVPTSAVTPPLDFVTEMTFFCHFTSPPTLLEHHDDNENWIEVPTGRQRVLFFVKDATVWGKLHPYVTTNEQGDPEYLVR